MKANLMALISVVLITFFSQHSAASDETDRLEVPFGVHSSGFIVITAEINGREAKFIVDSGAEMCVIHEKEVRYLKLKPGKKNGSAGGLGNGWVSSSPVDVAAITFMNVDYRDHPFVAIDLSDIEKSTRIRKFCGLIGSDFLNQHRAIIDYNKKTISLVRPKAATGVENDE